MPGCSMIWRQEICDGKSCCELAMYEPVGTQKLSWSTKKTLSLLLLLLLPPLVPLLPAVAEEDEAAARTGADLISMVSMSTGFRRKNLLKGTSASMNQYHGVRCAASERSLRGTSDVSSAV